MLLCPTFGSDVDRRRDCSRRMAVNGMLQQLCREEEVGFVDLCDSFVGREMACILVERGLPFLPRECQGRLPVAWVKYGI